MPTFPTPLPLLLQGPTTTTTNPFLLFMESAGWTGRFVFVLLVVLSIASWAVMISKWLQFRRGGHHTGRFLDVFRRSQRFSEVHAASTRLHASPLVGLFQAGYLEVDAQIKAQGKDGGTGGPYRLKSLDTLQRSMRRAYGDELLALSRGTGLLATTAAASPFIGLFGTVWGIMLTFQDIGTTGSTSLVAVAPGIAEALVNTAAGLAAAIPALMGYNYFGNLIRRARMEMDDFILEFLNLAERNFT
ncbi:MAG: MotA/TolQ/ExbB proton channel family protein [Thermoanaerobaculia bacterium]